MSNQSDSMSPCSSDVLAGADEVTFRLDSRLIFRDVSPSCESVFGFPPSDFIGRSILKVGVAHPLSIIKAIPNLKRILAGEALEPVPYQLTAADGCVRNVCISGRPVIEDGRVTGVVRICRDVT